MYEMKNFLTKLSLTIESFCEPDVFPFNVLSIAQIKDLHFTQPVTFFVGENGSGKSTLLEAVAAAWGLHPEGGSRNFITIRSESMVLEQALKLQRSARRVRDSYFFRAESYFNVANIIDVLDQEPSFGPNIIDSYGGRSLHQQSHGESFLATFLNRFRGDGFYILDEPEAALSPMRQMSFLARLHELVQAGSQFLIATHSPILMTYPNATIMLLGDGPPRCVRYQDTEHFKIIRDFLNRPDVMLKVLMENDS
jgi:predicted ATPase